MEIFDTLVDRKGIGNMKGQMMEKYQNDPKMLVLWGAEMDYATAPVITKRLQEIAKRGLYGYTLQDEAYNQAICKWMKKVRNIDIAKEDIVPTLGTVFGLNTAIRAFTNPGDEVLLQSPSYYRFDVAIENNNRKIVYNPLKKVENHYEIDFEDLAIKMARPAVKMMVLCNPHNPTSSVFDLEALKKIADLAIRNDVIVFNDEILGEYQFSRNPVSYAQATWQNAIVSTSLGKCFSFTGVNHANVLIHDEGIREQYLKQRKIDHFGSIDPFFYNAVIAGYSKEGYQWVEGVKQQVTNNYAMIVDFLAEHIPDIHVADLQGGFTAWFDFRALNMTQEELDQFMIEKVHVLSDTGSEYGTEGIGFYRMNIATTKDVIKSFLNQLLEAYNEIK